MLILPGEYWYNKIFGILFKRALELKIKRNVMITYFSKADHL